MKNKIKALLVMANDPSASEQERETAGRQASKLMAKHQIDLMDVEFELTEAVVSGMRPGKKSGAKVPPWIGFIAIGVSQFCGVRVVAHGPLVKFRGEISSVGLAVWQFQALVEGCYRASQGLGNSGIWRNGYAAAIQARMRRMDVQVQGEGGTALVVSRSRLDEAMDAQWGEAGEGKKASARLHAVGYQAGLNAHIPTHKPVAGGQLRLT